MAPIRRYLRITKYSVLECRIYVDNPALVQTWLLNPRDPVLPRVIESVRPLVLPKLREEKELERSRRKGSKKRKIKDVVTAADFEVSIFLTETNTRHSLLYKHKHFRDKTQTKLTSNSTKLTGASRGAPIDVEGDEGLCQGSGSPVLRREESDEIDAVILDEIPTIAEVANQPDVALNQQSKRRRDQKQPTVAGDGDDEDADEEADENYNLAGAIRIDSSADDDEHSDSDELFVETRPSKRRKEKETEPEPIAGDDKKKLAMDISYEGFAIYGRVLCLVVKRRESGRTALAVASNKTQTTGGQAMMENWITSTQMPAAEGADEADA